MESKTEGKIEIPIQTHTGFGPFILQMILTEDIIEDFNISFEQIIDFEREDDFVFLRAKDDLFDKRLKIPFDVLKGYADFFQQSIRAYMTMAKNSSAPVADNWTVTFENAYIASCKSGNFIHARTGSDNQLSCLAFISSTDEVDAGECQIELSVPGSSSSFYRRRFSISPKKGDMYIFPSCFQISMKPIRQNDDFELRIFEGWMTISDKGDDPWPMLHTSENISLEEDL